MGSEHETAAAEVERLTQLRDEAEKGSAEHRELNHQLIKAPPTAVRGRVEKRRSTLSDLGQ
jgi:hypothetical protein